MISIFKEGQLMEEQIILAVILLLSKTLGDLLDWRPVEPKQKR